MYFSNNSCKQYIKNIVKLITEKDLTKDSNIIWAHSSDG